ncbi:MAG: alpha-galactosidase, partial [Anaerolineae bacterium]
VAAGDDPGALLARYATILGDSMGARRPDRIPTGWCSWYSFFESAGAREVRSNLEASRQAGLEVGCFLVDDGHQRSLGDWLDTDRSRFPEGMAPLAEEIRETGREAGIWVAPFGVGARSKLYEAHPDWMLRDEEDDPVVAWRHRRDTAFALDLTHPEAQAWLEETFRTLREWGYTFFKADFLYAGALPGRRHDPSQTRAQALRRGLEIIREAVGDGFVLGCGAPLWPSVGLVDGMRIGADVAAHWRPLWHDLAGPSAANALRNTISRSFMHRRLWLNDPDCVLLRPRGHDSSLVLNETRTLATVVGLSGGLTFSGDDLGRLNPARMRYLERMLPPYGEAATAGDLFSRELPALLVLPIVRPHGRWVLAAAINWGDRTVTTTLDLARLGLDPGGLYHAYHYWRGRYLGRYQGTLELDRHQPHETALLLFQEVADRPQLLTSTFHLTQGAVEIAAVQREAADGRERLRVSLARPGRQSGSLVFAVPEPFRVLGGEVDGRRRGLRPSAPGVFSLGLTVDGAASVEVAFGKG